MLSSALIWQVVSYGVPLVAGWLLRHYNIGLPGLPSVKPAPLPTPAPATGDHVGLLEQALGVGKAEAEALLKAAVRDVLAKGLADLRAASQAQAK